jgi:hypothetical protein
VGWLGLCDKHSTDWNNVARDGTVCQGFVLFLLNLSQTNLASTRLNTHFLHELAILLGEKKILFIAL